MAKLFNEAGVIAITAFISPFRADRRRARKLVAEEDFIEVYCRCSLAVCEKRDVKGLYAKTRAGEIKEFTGISSPYEAPEQPELILDTDKLPLEDCVNRVVDLLLSRNILQTAGKKLDALKG